jgi:hypothetical protein
LPAVGASLGISPNCMKPPEVLRVPLLKVPLPAVESPSKMSTLLLVKVASPAVAVSVKFKKALLVKVALSAVEVAPKVMVPKLVKSVKLPAVALLRNDICAAPRLTTKFCTIPELFVMPTPLMVITGTAAGLLAIVNALAPGLNTMPLTSVFAERKTLVVEETPNVAVSADPLGTTVPVQLVNPVGRSTKFQSPLKPPNQVPLSAKLDSIGRIKTNAGRSQVMEATRMEESFLVVPSVILLAFVFIASAVMDD